MMISVGRGGREGESRFRFFSHLQIRVWDIPGNWSDRGGGGVKAGRRTEWRWCTTTAAATAFLLPLPQGHQPTEPNPPPLTLSLLRLLLLLQLLLLLPPPPPHTITTTYYCLLLLIGLGRIYIVQCISRWSGCPKAMWSVITTPWRNRMYSGLQGHTPG